jgi:beta-glucanase (GH16 family)
MRERDRRLSPRSRSALSVIAVAALLLSGCSAQPAVGRPSSDTRAPSPSSSADSPTKPVEAGEGLVWSEEFDAPGSPSTLWKRMEGAGGWGNEELQNYTASDENSYVADGILHIVARKASTVDASGISSEYTSARLMTYAAFRYGRIEARIAVPAASGLWSAFWMLGTFSTPDASWPGVGELDLMEYVDQARDLNNGVVGAKKDGTAWSRVESHPNPTGWSGDWHVYAVEWTADSVTYSVDGQTLGVIRKADLESDQLWSFDNPAHIIMNIAVGGRWPDPRIDDGLLPADYLVDYVRVYDSEVHEVPESWLPPPAD